MPNGKEKYQEKLSLFVGDERYKSKDDAGREEALNQFFNKYTTPYLQEQKVDDTEQYRQQFLDKNLKKKEVSEVISEPSQELVEQPTEPSLPRAEQAVERQQEVELSPAEEAFSEYKDIDETVTALEAGRKEMDIQPITAEQEAEARRGITTRPTEGIQAEPEVGELKPIPGKSIEDMVREGEIARLAEHTSSVPTKFLPTEVEAKIVEEEYGRDDAIKIINRAKAEAAREAPGRLESALGSAVQSYAKVLGSIPKSIAILAKKMDEETGTGSYEGKNVEDLVTYEFGEFLEETARSMFPTNRKYQEDFWTTKLPGGAGSMAGFITGGLMKKAFTNAAKKYGVKEAKKRIKNSATKKALDKLKKVRPDEFAAITGGATMGAGEYEAAKAAGATDDQAMDAFFYNFAVGTSEGFPIAAFFNRLDKTTGGGFKRALAKGVSGSVEEMTQEVMSGFGSNVVAMNTYDETRKLYDDLMEQGEVGALLGFAMNALGVSLKNRLQDETLTKEEETEIQKAINFTEERVNELPEDKSQIVTEDEIKEDEPVEEVIEEPIQEPIAEEAVEEPSPEVVAEEAAPVEEAVDVAEEVIKEPVEVTEEEIVEPEKEPDAEEIRTELESPGVEEAVVEEEEEPVRVRDVEEVGVEAEEEVQDVEPLPEEEVSFDRLGEAKKGKIVEDLGKDWRVQSEGRVYRVSKENMMSPPSYSPEAEQNMGEIEGTVEGLDEQFKKVTSKDIKKKSDEDSGKVMAKILPIKEAWVGVQKAQDVIGRQFDKLENTVANVTKKGLQHKSNAVRQATSALRNVMGGLPYTQEEVREKMRLKGGIDYGAKHSHQFMDNAMKMIGDDMSALKRVHSVLDPEMYPGEEVAYEDLNATEVELHDLLRTANDFTHEWNYANGLIDEKTYNKHKGKYIARIYEEHELGDMPEGVKEFVKDANSGYKTKIISDIFKKRKDPAEIDKEIIKDPVFLTAKRVAQMYQNQAVMEYAGSIADSPSIRKMTEDQYAEAGSPSGYSKLSGKRNEYGDLTNMYVPNHIAEDFSGFFFDNKLMNATYDAFKVYDRTKFRQFLKKYHTVFSPTVQLGNFSSNYVFAFLTGIDPISHTKNLVKARKQIKEGGDEYIELIKAGVLGSDVLTKDLRPTIEATKTAKKVDQTKDGLKKLGDSIVKKLGLADEKLMKMYEGSDNLAKLSAYITLKNDYGYTPSEAINKVYKGFQNYAAVGKMYDVASKTPFLGNPYVKFSADLSRIMKNAVTQRPLQVAMMFGILKMTSKMLSEWSGEDEEKRKVREARSWIPKIPFPESMGGDVPLVFQTPVGEINIARYLSPFYVYDQGYSGNKMEYISKFLPYQVESSEEASGELLTPELADVLLGTYAQVVWDKDFRGQSIQDPKASPFKPSRATSSERTMNKLRFIARSHIPFYKSADDFYNAYYTGKDYYGRTRDLTQSILNNFIKIQEMGDEELKSTVEKEISFLEHKRLNVVKRAKGSARDLQKEIAEVQESELSEDKKKNQIEKLINKHNSRLEEFISQEAEAVDNIHKAVDKYNKLK